jgi:uncharacterized membrane protein HdeD (DUF308 family)
MTTAYSPRRDLRIHVEDLDPAWGRRWWIFIVTGSMWLLFSLVVFRFDIHSVAAVAVAVAVLCISAGVNEFFAIGASTGGWKVARATLGGLFSLVGVIALVYPHRTFAEVAAIFSFFLLIKGAFDIFTALMLRRELDVWWVPLLVGVAELLLAFWAAGNFGREAVLLVVWVRAAALARGVTEIVLAFRLRDLAHGEPPAARGTP